jgi:hypothetical protein
MIIPILEQVIEKALLDLDASAGLAAGWITRLTGLPWGLQKGEIATHLVPIRCYCTVSKSRSATTITLTV